VLNTSTTRRIGAIGLAGALLFGACGDGGDTEGPGLTGDIRIDGSSTVYPVLEAMAEEFQIENRAVRVAVAFSGTGGGFKKFCAGETDANNASRPINAEEELEALCEPAGVEPVELRIAIDGLTVLVHPENDWASCMTVEELRLVWDQGSTVQRWNQVRPEWPDEPIRLFGPGADSGTFDYFTEEVNGEAQRSRSDFTQSEDDNALVIGIAGDRYALGYFGYAYYVENRDKVKAVAIDDGDGCIEATDETINSGTYTPLSRPLYIYPSVQSLERPQVAAFFRFLLEYVDLIVPEIGYVALPADQLQASKDALEAAIERAGMPPGAGTEAP
jgi:phosphate transport system substrate-binding protein